MFTRLGSVLSDRLESLTNRLESLTKPLEKYGYDGFQTTSDNHEETKTTVIKPTITIQSDLTINEKTINVEHQDTKFISQSQNKNYDEALKNAKTNDNGTLNLEYKSGTPSTEQQRTLVPVESIGNNIIQDGSKPYLVFDDKGKQKGLTFINEQDGKYSIDKQSVSKSKGLINANNNKEEVREKIETTSLGRKSMPFFSHRPDESITSKAFQGVITLAFKGPFVLAEKIASLIPAGLSFGANKLAKSLNKDIENEKNTVSTKIKGGLVLGLQGTANALQATFSLASTGLSVLKQGGFTALSLITQRSRGGEKDAYGKKTWFGGQNKERTALAGSIFKQTIKDIVTSFKNLNETRKNIQAGNQMKDEEFHTPANTRKTEQKEATVKTGIISPQKGGGMIDHTIQTTQQKSQSNTKENQEQTQEQKQHAPVNQTSIQSPEHSSTPKTEQQTDKETIEELVTTVETLLKQVGELTTKVTELENARQTDSSISESRSRSSSVDNGFSELESRLNNSLTNIHPKDSNSPSSPPTGAYSEKNVQQSKSATVATR